jgi:hypothetical protein
MSLADESGQMIRFITWYLFSGYSLSALLTFVVYITYAKWFTRNRLKEKHLPDVLPDTSGYIKLLTQEWIFDYGAVHHRKLWKEIIRKINIP